MRVVIDGVEYVPADKLEKALLLLNKATDTIQENADLLKKWTKEHQDTPKGKRKSS